jgi:hypothetical protein
MTLNEAIYVEVDTPYWNTGLKQVDDDVPHWGQIIDPVAHNCLHPAHHSSEQDHDVQSSSSSRLVQEGPTKERQ